MKRLYLLITIVNRAYGDEYTSFFRSYSDSAVLMFSGEGTTAREDLAVLGLESTSKAVLFTFVGPNVKKQLFKELKRVMHIEAPGNGIALAIPLKSITTLGIEQLAPQFYDWVNEDVPSEENIEMTDYKYELIVVIANQDSTDEIMTAARGAGARGGTLVNAKGTAPAEVRKFFGLNISEGKDMLFIASKTEDKAKIMKAISDKNVNGLKAVSFSLPIDTVAGLFSEDR